VFFGFTGCLLAASLCGCFVVAEDPGPGPDTGTLDVNITIDDANDFLVCSDFAIDEIKVVIDDGVDVFTTVTDCNDLGVTFLDVPEGTYDVEVTLLAGGRPVSTSGDGTIDVVGGRLSEFDVNFPPDSIVPPG
jgi:hypothetical protein